MRAQGLFHQVVALLLITCSYASQDAPVPHDVWDETEELLNQFNEVVQNTIRTAWGEIGLLQRNLVDTANNISIEASAQVEEFSDKIRSQLDYLIILAEAFGVPQCTEYRKEQFEITTKNVKDNINICVDEVTNLAMGLLSNASLSMSSAQSQVYTLRLKLEDCRASDDELCAAIVRQEVILATDEVPTAILDQMLVVILLTVDSEQALHTCANERVGYVYIEGNRIVFQIENCLINEGMKSDLARTRTN